MKQIMVIDQSTSGTKVLLFDERGNMSHRVTELHEQKYPGPGQVEHDPEEIMTKTRTGIDRVLKESGVAPDSIAALAITNQRETIFLWDRATGRPLHNAVVWQDQRGTGICSRLSAKEEMVRKKTGLLLDSFFSASKLAWIMEHRPVIRRAASEGRVMVGTSDSWLIWNLTGGKVHATDFSNASRTLLFNIYSLQWDRELLELFGLEDLIFPEVLPSDAVFGHLADTETLAGLPVGSVMGDSHAALFGHRCFTPGEAKVTYGTGSSVMINIGTGAGEPGPGFVASLGWGQGGEVVYVFEGNIHSTGDTLRWVRENLGLFGHFDEAVAACEELQDNGGVYLVPAFAGLGAPYWKHDIRAMIYGLSRSSDRRHIIRAAHESIAYQIADLVGVMAGYMEEDIRIVNADGGPAQNPFLMQFQTDILDRNVQVPATEEISARGVAYMAGITFGIWKNPEALRGLREDTRLYTPGLDGQTRERYIHGWKTAVDVLIGR